MNSTEPRVQKKKPHPLVDKLLLGDLEKYVRFDNFPWKLLIHIIVLIFSSAQILLIVNFTGLYSRSSYRVWLTQFFDEEIQVNTLDYDDIKFFYDMSELRSHVQKSVENYFAIGTEESTTIDAYEYLSYNDESTGEPVQYTPVLEAFFIRENERKNFDNILTFNLTEDNLGPFDENSDFPLEYFLSNTTNMKITYQLKHCIPSESTTPFD